MLGGCAEPSQEIGPPIPKIANHQSPIANDLVSLCWVFLLRRWGQGPAPVAPSHSQRNDRLFPASLAREERVPRVIISGYLAGGTGSCSRDASALARTELSESFIRILEFQTAQRELLESLRFCPSRRNRLGSWD